MPRQTRKWVAAVEAARQAEVEVTDDQNQIYERLQLAGWWWDAAVGRFQYHEPQVANEASKVVRVRVWADLETVPEMADDIAELLTKHLGFELINKSRAYQNRPPQQRDGRVYLEFVPPTKGHRRGRT